MTFSRALDHLKTSLDASKAYTLFGKIIDIQGMCVVGSADHPSICIASQVIIVKDTHSFYGEVVALKNNQATILLATPIMGLSIGDPIHYKGGASVIYPSAQWLGRTLNAFGEPLDSLGGMPKGSMAIPLKKQPLSAIRRRKVNQVMDLGIRAMNSFTPVCQGQRLGIFSGSGVGKSVLISMLARNTACDVCVIGLIGERGREVREFIEDTLGKEGLQKSILVIATSDEPPLARRQAAYMALTIAEYFRDLGKNVLCMMDSLTRFAMAQREIGLSAGEPPTTKGYPPSTFFELAQLCERAGPGLDGSGMITAFFSVLVDGDDHNEPISDAVRGILDGHIYLDRALAERGHYPAIHVLKSISRLTSTALNDHQKDLLQQAKKNLSAYEDMAELIRIGAYQQGSDADVDRAIQLYPSFFEFLTQKPDERTSFNETFERLEGILGR